MTSNSFLNISQALFHSNYLLAYDVYFAILQFSNFFSLQVLPNLLDGSIVGVKRMGEVDQQPFQDVCLQKFSREEGEMRSMELSSLWQNKVNNSNWQPFKKVFKDEKLLVWLFSSYTSTVFIHVLSQYQVLVSSKLCREP